MSISECSDYLYLSQPYLDSNERLVTEQDDLRREGDDGISVMKLSVFRESDMM